MCSSNTLLLKKAGKDEEDMSSDQPISNLFLNVIDTVVARRIEHHMRINDLYDRYQSAYHKDQRQL